MMPKPDQGVARWPAPPPPIKLPPMINNYDNIAQRCLVEVTDTREPRGP